MIHFEVEVEVEGACAPSLARSAFELHLPSVRSSPPPNNFDTTTTTSQSRRSICLCNIGQHRKERRGVLPVDFQSSEVRHFLSTSLFLTQLWVGASKASKLPQLHSYIDNLFINCEYHRAYADISLCRQIVYSAAGRLVWRSYSRELFTSEIFTDSKTHWRNNAQPGNTRASQSRCKLFISTIWEHNFSCRHTATTSSSRASASTSHSLGS